MNFSATAFLKRALKRPALSPGFLRTGFPDSSYPTNHTHIPTPIKPHRTLWISDTHLGTPGCKAAYLLNFLKHHQAETLFLVGDIVDGLQLKRSWCWDHHHSAVLHAILDKVAAGTKVIYIPGNHDAAMRQFVKLHLGGVLVARDWVHRTACGKRLLVVHGDLVDGALRYARWLALLGDWSYQGILWANTLLDRWRQFRGKPYWSLSAFIKSKSKSATAYIEQFERSMALLARRRNLNGVVCGHIHHPQVRDIDGILYCNDGDWVENCTALVEHHNGSLELVRWTHTDESRPLPEEVVSCNSV